MVSASSMSMSVSYASSLTFRTLLNVSASFSIRVRLLAVNGTSYLVPSVVPIHSPV